MEIIEQIFIDKLRRCPNYTAFAKKYTYKVFTCFIICNMSITVMIALNLNFDIDLYVSLHIYFLTIVANMHALFYIDLINFYGERVACGDRSK